MTRSQVDQPPTHTLIAGPLITFDIFALVVNKMVGTGIYTTPPLVLALTGDWRIAIGLWAAGFVYTIIRSEHHCWSNTLN